MILAHSIRLDPNDKQETYFRRACGTSRWAYNKGLEMWESAYAAGEKPNGRALKKKLNAVRREQFPWTHDVHRDCTARPFDDLQVAFSAFFAKRSKYPAFKKKGKYKDSFYVASDRLSFDGERVRLPIVGWIKMRESLRLEGKVMGATCSRTADQWHIAVQVDVGDLHEEQSGDAVVGVDLGIKASATLSTGEVIEGPKALRSNLKRLRRLSRRHGRKEKGKNGRRKSAMKLARLHDRIANVRKDWTHELSTRLVRENQAVGIEDLHVRGMARNRKLARSIVDEGWGELRRQLTYKAPMHGTEIVVHDRWFPSSKTCSGCGVVKDSLSLFERTFRCGNCGLVLDRDHNAAINLRPVPAGSGEFTPVEIAALAGTSAPVKLWSSKPESSGRSPEMVAV